MTRSYTVAEIAARIAARVTGDAAVMIDGLGALPTAVAGQISHLSNRAFRKYLATTRASAVLLRDNDAAACPTVALIVSDPYVAYAQVSALFAAQSRAAQGCHPSSVVDHTARIAASASIGAGVVIGARAQIGENVQIDARCVIGDDVVLGDDVHLWPNVTLYRDVWIGAGSSVHSASVIGADGFGYARGNDGVQHKIAQLGGVRIGAQVEIGANTTVDRGAIEHTVIEDGVKIDNQVQIGHNCVIGAHTLICGCVGIVGSTRIGAHCVLAGGVGVGGDGPISISDGVIVSGMTHVSQSIAMAGVYSSGTLMSASRGWKKNALRFRELDTLVRRVIALERTRTAGAPEPTRASAAVAKTRRAAIRQGKGTSD